MSFDYRTATEEQVLERAEHLPGMLLGHLPLARFEAVSASTGRAEVGHAVESFFGIPRNALPAADFPSAGVELKVLPLEHRGSGLTVKERTVISMIDFNSLVEEDWASAKVRSKLKILFVFFEHLPNRPKSEFSILDILLWQPDEETEGFIRADWERVRDKVRHGHAHELSESDGRIMGPCTKGRDAGQRRRQPFSDQLAKSRAFALKPAFTRELFRSMQARRPALQAIEVGNPSRFEENLLSRFRPFVGRTVDEVAKQLGMPRSAAKSYAASVARRIFGASSSKGEIRQFAEMGLTPRVTRIDDELTPYEATSFPSFRYRDVIAETWEDSDLLARVEYMLFLPVHGRRKNTEQGDCKFHLPRFWRPSAADLELIRREWELYRIEIERGMADRLTPASETVAIHVRPHGRNAQDTDDAPGIGPLVKKSFWLNRPFVAQILRGER